MQGLYVIEVLSYEQRLKGMSVALFFKACADVLNFFATPIAMAKIGYKAYIIWTIWNGIEFVIAYFFFVETKGFTLEELDAVFEAKNPRKASTMMKTVVVDAEGGIMTTKEV